MANGRKLASRPCSPTRVGDKTKETLMGKLRLEASWCKGAHDTGRIQLEFDLMTVYLLIKLAFGVAL